MLCTIGSGSPRICLNAHADTVPPNGQSTPTARIEGDILYGLGSCDDKASIAAMVTAFLDIAAKGEPKGTVDLLISVDEEGDARGVKSAIAQGYKCDYAIVGEPTSLNVVRVHCGLLFLKLTTTGVAAHGCNPSVGVNAIERMVGLVEELRAAIAPFPSHLLVGGSSLNLGEIHAGDRPNRVPNLCQARIDIRFPPPATIAETLDAVRRVIDPRDWASYEIEKSGEAPETPAESSLVQAILASARELGVESRPTGLRCWTEAESFKTGLGIDAVVCGPGGLEQAHTSNEFVSISQTRAAASLYACAVERLLETARPCHSERSEESPARFFTAFRMTEEDSICFARDCRCFLFTGLFATCLGAAWSDAMAPRTLIAREGKGYLERVGTQLVLHLKGSPEEMGRQHGVLLKDHVQTNIRALQSKGKDALGSGNESMLDVVWRQQLKYLPERYVGEMRALAEGAGLDFDLIRRANTVPELFHCSGFAVFGKATKDGKLYHGRVLDYGVDKGLQDHAVVIIAEPDGLAAFVNVSYAGFIGSVTGMNTRQVSFGEMGGRQVGPFEGTPMSFLMRRGLEEAGTLDQARALFRDSKRTSGFYYVLADAKIPSAFAVTATAREIEFFKPGETKGPMNVAIEDAVVMSGGDRYALLTKRIKEGWGSSIRRPAWELMRRPVAMTHCLHAVLMSPKTCELWVAHATSDGQPASEQH